MLISTPSDIALAATFPSSAVLTSPNVIKSDLRSANAEPITFFSIPVALASANAVRSTFINSVETSVPNPEALLPIASSSSPLRFKAFLNVAIWRREVWSNFSPMINRTGIKLPIDSPKSFVTSLTPSRPPAKNLSELVPTPSPLPNLSAKAAVSSAASRRSIPRF